MRTGLLLILLCLPSLAQVKIKPTTTVAAQLKDTRGKKILNCGREFYTVAEAKVPPKTLVDTCIEIRAVATQEELRFAPILKSPNASEFTVEHYTIFISADGRRLMSLIQLAPPARSFNLSKLALARGSYTFYVKAVGKQHMAGSLSKAVPYIRD